MRGSARRGLVTGLLRPAGTAAVRPSPGQAPPTASSRVCRAAHVRSSSQAADLRGNLLPPNTGTLQHGRPAPRTCPQRPPRCGIRLPGTCNSWLQGARRCPSSGPSRGWPQCPLRAALGPGVSAGRGAGSCSPTPHGDRKARGGAVLHLAGSRPSASAARRSLLRRIFPVCPQ